MDTRFSDTAIDVEAIERRARQLRAEALVSSLNSVWARAAGRLSRRS